MAEIHQFTYGSFTAVFGYLLSVGGSLFGLACTAQARTLTGRARAARLFLASLAIGGAGIWLMHFVAMLGFEVVGADLRYDPGMTIISLGIGVVTVGIGLSVVGTGRRSTAKLVLGGAFTGAGVAGMHYTGMAAVQLGGTVSYEPALVIASVIVAIVVATVALWFTLNVTGWSRILVASLIMGVAVWAMHYTAMAAVRVNLHPTTTPMTGVSPILLIVPITAISAVALVGLVFVTLSTSGETDLPIAVRSASA
jgi:NO-binding membrane sensor protein with MHYT domain